MQDDIAEHQMAVSNVAIIGNVRLGGRAEPYAVLRHTLGKSAILGVPGTCYNPPQALLISL